MISTVEAGRQDDDQVQARAYFRNVSSTPWAPDFSLGATKRCCGADEIGQIARSPIARDVP
jgi:hypothetical protein